MKHALPSPKKISLWLLAILALGGFAVFQPHRIVDIAADDLLRFDKSLIRVKKGIEVTIVLKNNGRIPSLRHSFVLLKPGTDADHFGNAAMNAKGEAIPSSMKSAVLAYTSFAESGQSVRTTFLASEPGTYPYLCSFPGHASVFHGKLVVE